MFLPYNLIELHFVLLSLGFEIKYKHLKKKKNINSAKEKHGKVNENMLLHIL